MTCIFSNSVIEYLFRISFKDAPTLEEIEGTHQLEILTGLFIEAVYILIWRALTVTFRIAFIRVGSGVPALSRKPTASPNEPAISSWMRKPRILANRPSTTAPTPWPTPRPGSIINKGRISCPPLSVKLFSQNVESYKSLENFTPFYKVQS